MTTICTPAYKRFDTLSNFIDSICALHVHPSRVGVVDNSGGALPLESLRDRLEAVGITYEVLSQSHNIGVAAAWNLCYTRYADDDVVMCNDDIVLAPDAITEILAEAWRYRLQGFFYGGSGGSANAFSMFYLPQEVYSVVGRFDERFYPAYFEDNDYSWRLRLAGYPMVLVPTSQYAHVGSASLAALNPHERAMHDRQFNVNAAYFQQKWGGPPHGEKYQWPFNAAPTIQTGRIQ